MGGYARRTLVRDLRFRYLELGVHLTDRAVVAGRYIPMENRGNYLSVSLPRTRNSISHPLKSHSMESDRIGSAPFGPTPNRRPFDRLRGFFRVSQACHQCR